MSEYFDEFEGFDDIDDMEVSSLISRFEQMQQQNEQVFFDVYECEDIIDYYFARENLKQTGQALNYAIKLHPDSDALLLRLAMLHASANESEEALQLLKKVKPDAEEDPEINFAKAGIYSQLKMYPQAVNEYKKLLDVW